MKRRETMVWVMLAESVAFPVIALLARLFGYTLKVGSGLIFAIVMTALYIFCVIWFLRSQEKQIGKAARIALSVTMLLDQIQTLFFILYIFISGSSRFPSIPAMLLLAVWCWVTVPVTAFYVKKVALKVVFYILSGLMVLPIGFLILMSGFGRVTAVASDTSPDGTWCAEVIEYDGGATGGSVKVDVYRKEGSFSIGSFEFRKEETKIYRGPWGSDREVSWIDDEHLSYNSAIYTAPFK